VFPAGNPEQVMKEVESLFMTYSADPVYGVEFSVEKQAEPKDLKVSRPPTLGVLAATLRCCMK